MAKKRRDSEPWIVRTLADVARFFSKSPATIKTEWRRRGMPGKSGGWDLREIFEWREGHREHTGAKNEGESRFEAERRKAVADADMAERKAAQQAGELIEVTPIIRLFTRHVNEAKAIMDQLADRVLSLLPAKTTPKTRRRVREECRKILDDACRSLGDLLSAEELTGEE